MHRPTLGAGAAPTGVPAAAPIAGWAVISLHEPIPGAILLVVSSTILGKILFSAQSRRCQPSRHLAHCAHSRTGASTDKILMKAGIKTKVDYVSKHMAVCCVRCLFSTFYLILNLMHCLCVFPILVI